jgi:hypothetical protein
VRVEGGGFSGKAKKVNGWRVLVFGFALSVYEWAHDQVIFLS